MTAFDWESTKTAANIKKHGASFEEAPSVFYDEFALQFVDDDHSSDEERFLSLGVSTGARMLLVCRCDREAGNVIRIISVRKATKRDGAFCAWPAKP